MARIIYLKDKKDFKKHYEREGWNYLREVVEWQDSFILDKVNIRILIPSMEKEAREALKKIKD